ncbi:hypothetical protein D920_01691 [Enterococcus faecalis 13-SD-W-01]|nr:hypothetical protein D920_01691 [Enterococcus faecalis 13-SD-W-01]
MLKITVIFLFCSLFLLSLKLNFVNTQYKICDLPIKNEKIKNKKV